MRRGWLPQYVVTPAVGATASSPWPHPSLRALNTAERRALVNHREDVARVNALLSAYQRRAAASTANEAAGEAEDLCWVSRTALRGTPHRARESAR